MLYIVNRKVLLIEIDIKYCLSEINGKLEVANKINWQLVLEIGRR